MALLVWACLLVAVGAADPCGGDMEAFPQWQPVCTGGPRCNPGFIDEKNGYCGVCGPKEGSRPCLAGCGYGLDFDPTLSVGARRCLRCGGNAATGATERSCPNKPCTHGFQVEGANCGISCIGSSQQQEGQQ